MERPVIKFGYDGDWVLRVKPGRADRSRLLSADYEGTAFAGKFVPAPIDCRPWVDAQVGGWDLFFSMDIEFRVEDIGRGLFSVPPAMTGKLGAFGPFHLGIYTGVRIKTSPGWVTLIDRVADPATRDRLPFTTETAVIETDWYTWFKNFAVIRPILSRFRAGEVVTIARGTPLCRVRVVPRQELVVSEEFTAEDRAAHEAALAEYNRAELALRDQRRYRSAGSGTFYPLYKLRAMEHRVASPGDTGGGAGDSASEPATAGGEQDEPA